MSGFDGVIVLSPAENDNTEESEEEDDGDRDGGEDEKVTIVVTDIVQYFDDQVPCQVCRGNGRTEGGLEVPVALLLLLAEVRRYLGGAGRGGLSLDSLCH